VLAGARVVGDLRAPEVELAAGATIEGRVDRDAPRAPEPPRAERPTLRARAPLRRPTLPPIGAEERSAPVDADAADTTPEPVAAARPTRPEPPAPGPPAPESPAPPRFPRLSSRVRLVPRRGEP
jgi:hypothetical protein